jgi:hypothetical protein
VARSCSSDRQVLHGLTNPVRAAPGSGAGCAGADGVPLCRRHVSAESASARLSQRVEPKCGAAEAGDGLMR